MASTLKANESDARHNICDLESVLQKKFGDKLIIVNYSVDNLVAAGENYGSDILKVSAKIQRSKDAPVEELQFVAKTVSDSNFSHDWSCIFKKESFLYNNIIPMYRRIELENGVDEKNTIANMVPQFIGHRLSLDPKVDVADKDAVILLENLKPRGYYVENKRLGMSFQHASLALKALARFHALGIVAKRRYPAEFEEIKAMAQLWGFSTKMSNVACANFIAMVKREPRIQRYAERIERITERRQGCSKDELSRHEVWSTVAHGDFWTNNAMFHADETSGEVDDVKLIDFQTYRFVDVFVDLSYFLCTSLDEEVKLRRFDELVDLYYETLVGVLGRLGLDDLSDFSREKFDQRFGEIAANEVLYGAVALNFFTADVPSDAEDRKNLFAELLACRGNELYFEKLTNILRILEERDWLH